MKTPTLRAAVRVCGANVPAPNCCVAVMSPLGVTPTTTCTGPQHSSSGVGSITVKFSVICGRSLYLRNSLSRYAVNKP